MSCRGDQCDPVSLFHHRYYPSELYQRSHSYSVLTGQSPSFSAPLRPTLAPSNPGDLLRVSHNSHGTRESSPAGPELGRMGGLGRTEPQVAIVIPDPLGQGNLGAHRVPVLVRQPRDQHGALDGLVLLELQLVRHLGEALAVAAPFELAWISMFSPCQIHLFYGIVEGEFGSCTVVAGHVVVQVYRRAGHGAIRVGDLGDEVVVVKNDASSVTVEHCGVLYRGLFLPLYKIIKKKRGREERGRKGISFRGRTCELRLQVAGGPSRGPYL